MNNHGKYSINKLKDINFHIKVNRNSNPYNNKINQILSNDSHNYGIDKRPNKLKKEELLFKKMNKNKNKLQSLGNINNLSSLINKRKLVKNNNSEKAFPRHKPEKGIIDTFNKIRKNNRKINNLNKINKSNSNFTYLNNNYNLNNMNDYRAKVNNNKNKLKNTIFKTFSYNNNIKKAIKDLKNSNKKKNNNILIDDTTSNDTELLTESEKVNKETNLFVYRSEVQYPVKNLISNCNLQKQNNYNEIFQYNKNTLKALKDSKDENKNNHLTDAQICLFENISKSVGNSLTKRQIFIEPDDNFESNYCSPLGSRMLSNKRGNLKKLNNRNLLMNSANNTLRINNRFKNLKEKISPILFNSINEKTKKYSKDDKMNFSNYINRTNNNAKSCHQFYRKKCFSKEKNESNNKYLEIFDEICSNKEKTVYIQTKQNNKNNIFLDKDDEENYNIYNYKFYNRNRNIRMKNQLNLISIFCDSVEKFLIFILKYYYEYFISQMYKFIEYKNINDYKNYYNSENIIKNQNIHNLLAKRLKNKSNSKKLNYLDNEYNPINLSNYKKYDNNNNKINLFKIISRNDNSNNIYNRKSNSINKSLNHLICKNNNKEEAIYDKIQKKKNLSFNKVYIPKRKNTQYNKYKSLKISTKSFMSDLNINNYIDSNNNNFNNTFNLNNIYNQNIENNKKYKTINGDENIIKKINHITALKRKYINNNYINSSLNISANNSNENNNNYIKKIQLTSNNVYTKPIFKNIKKKMIEKENSDNYNFSSAQKKDSTENNKSLNELLLNNNNLDNIKNENKKFNSEKKNYKQKKIKNNLLCKKIVIRRKPKSDKANDNININKLNCNKTNENKEVKNYKEFKNREKEKNKENIITFVTNISENKETELNNNNNSEIIRSIIVKDVSSKDKLLNVYIKYYESNFKKFNSRNNSQLKHSLIIISNEPITILSVTKNKNSKNNNKYLHQILSSIIEEDEKSKANPSLNNSNSVISEEETEKNNTKNNNNNIINNSNFTYNIVIYLTNILQNLLDDNKKTILYTFMRNLKKIQNILYLKNSLIQYNSIIKNGSKENFNNIGDIYNKNENLEITYNGGNEVDLNNANKEEIRNNSSNNIFYYTADNSLFDDRINNKKNILIGSLLFKDFEIEDEDYDIIKPKRCLSSSSINQIKNNSSEKNLFFKNLLKAIVIEINNKKIQNHYFQFWKKIIKKNNNNDEINGNIDNGMNISNINKRRNILNDIGEVNIKDFISINDIKSLDNGKYKEYEEDIYKNREIKKDIKLIDKKDGIQSNNNKFRNLLISFVLKK